LGAGELSKGQIKALKKTSSIFTTSTLMPAIMAELIHMGVPAGMITITAKELAANSSLPAPQELTLAYPSLY
jgi:hypothetical protein